MSIQRAIHLMLQALMELQNNESANEPQATITVSLPPEELASKPSTPSKPRSKRDRSSQESSIYARQNSKVCNAILHVQHDDQDTGRDLKKNPHTITEMRTALLKKGYAELFQFKDETNQIRQLNRVKSMHAKRFGGLKDNPGVFLMKLPLPPRPKIIKLVVDGAQSEKA